MVTSENINFYYRSILARLLTKAIQKILWFTIHRETHSCLESPPSVATYILRLIPELQLPRDLLHLAIVKHIQFASNSGEIKQEELPSPIQEPGDELHIYVCTYVVW